MTRLIFKSCVSLWCSGQVVACTCKTDSFSRRRRFLFLCIVFFSVWSLYSYCWPCWSCTWINIYFTSKSGVLFWKMDFKSSWSAYLAKLATRKKPQAVSPLKQLNFFNVSWHHDKQHTVHHKLYCTVLYTQHPPVTHRRKLNLPFFYVVWIINIITLKSPLGLPPKNN